MPPTRLTPRLAPRLIAAALMLTEKRGMPQIEMQPIQTDRAPKKGEFFNECLIAS